MTKQEIAKEMPDRIWVWELHDNIGSSRGWNEKSGWNSVEYHRADLPPTPAEAMRCPEVMSLCLEVHTAMRNHGHALVNLRELRTALTALEQAVRHE